MGGGVEGWWKVELIEYPAETIALNDYTPTYLDPSSGWRIHRSTVGYYLWLVGRSPDATEKVRVWYTLPHSLAEGGASADTDTIPSGDKKAVLDLATSYACLSLATESAQAVNSNVPSDSAQWQGAQDKLLAVAKEWRRSYERHMAKGESSVGATVRIMDWDIRPKGTPARAWMTHGGRR